MYLSYFGLAEAPFSIAPAPRYLYMSQRHQEALAHLLYGINSGGGFVLLTGEVGTGKTTICRCLLEQIPATCDVAYIFNPKLTVEELLSTICIEFGIPFPAGNTSIKVFVDCINAHLLNGHAQGRHAVLIIDEAQNLSADVLEQMRLLTNLETNERKLLQIILLGQPELALLLERPELKQLAQRIVARYHLGPLSRPEVAAYVKHRLEVAGTQRPLFPTALMKRIHQVSGGVPRVINVLCDRALLGAYVQGKERVDGKILQQAEREVLPPPLRQRLHQPWPRSAWLAALGIVSLSLGAAYTAAIVYDFAPAKMVLPTAQPQTPAAPSPSTAPTPATRLHWPPAIPRSQHASIAYSTLFNTWNMPYTGGEPCVQAKQSGLRCETAQAGLPEIRQYNRPVVLMMRDEQGSEFLATLIALNADSASDSATFSLGTKTEVVTLDALAAQWSGQYLLLWRAPAVVQDTIRPGDRGAAVVWLREQIDKVEGAKIITHTVAPIKDNYDNLLAQRVKHYQLARGLVPDGNVGHKTLIRLLAETDATAPALTSVAEKL